MTGCNEETRVSIMGDDPPLCGNEIYRGGLCAYHAKCEVDSLKRRIARNLEENEKYRLRIELLSGGTREAL